MSLDRLQSWWREMSQPEGVERASRRERLKRTGWQFGALLVTVAFYAIVATVVRLFVVDEPLALNIILAWIGMLSTYLLIWDWGVDYFDIVPPWQFCEAQSREEL